MNRAIQRAGIIHLKSHPTLKKTKHLKSKKKLKTVNDKIYT